MSEPEYRSLALWYTDTEEAGAYLAEAAIQYPPSEREDWIDTACLAAKEQLKDLKGGSK